MTQQPIATVRLTLDDSAVQDFTASLRGEVLRPADEGYDDARIIHNGMIDRRPTLIARCAGVGPGKTAAVVGDGAVGLCGVIAAKRLGAEQIIIMGRHADRIALAKELGATDVVSERGEEAVERVRELTGGFGAHSVLECVGYEQAVETAIGIARPGGAVGRVGVPQDLTIPASLPSFFKNVTVGGGPAPVRAYMEDLLPDVLEGRIEPGRVLDRTVGLDGVPDGYRAMDDRESIKVMVRP